MTRRFRRDETGQALVIAAMGAFVLAIALAFTIDLGYGLLQRRVAQNEADAVAMEVGRLLATSIDSYGRPRSRRRIDIRTRYELTQQEVCDLARDVQLRNGRFTFPALGPDEKLQLTFETASGSQTKVNCTDPSDALVPDQTRSVLVRIDRSLRTLTGSLLGRSKTGVGASARAAIVGSPFTPDPQLSADDVASARSATAIARTWPIARFFDPTDYGVNVDPCGPLCDPADGIPVAFTGLGAEGLQVLDFSRDSSYGPQDPKATQLLTDWDHRGAILDRASACGGTWNTAGGEAPAIQNSSCSLPNWIEQPFQGALGLRTRWDDAPNFDNGGACSLAQSLTPWLPRPPSCSDRGAGDWVETTNKPLDRQVVDDMRDFISREGTSFPYSGSTVPSQFRNVGKTFGKAVVVWIYIWDCGQRFTGSEWNNTASCPAPDRAYSYPGGQPQRVHLLTAVPFTFYEGLVTYDAVEALWGGNFTDPGRCQADPTSCPGPNPLANSVFLVPDDQPWNPSDENNNCQGQCP